MSTSSSQPVRTPPNCTPNSVNNNDGRNAHPPAPLLLARTLLPPLGTASATRQTHSPDPIPLTPILALPPPQSQQSHSRHVATLDDHAATLMSVPLDTFADDDANGNDAQSANTSRANSPARHLSPPTLRPADSGTADDDLHAKPSSAAGVDSAASVARLAGSRDDQERLLRYTTTISAGAHKDPAAEDDDQGADDGGVTDQFTSHSWASTLSPHLMCGANLRTALGVYIGVALVTHLVMLVDGIHFLLPNRGPFASLYNTSAPSQLTRDSLAFLRGLTITESVVLSMAILIGLTCGAAGLLRRSHRLWAVYTFASIAHVLWNLVTSSLMIWVFPREFALAYTSAFMVLWLVATLIQIYAALCSYVELQVMRREAMWTARGQVVLRLA